MEDMYVEIKNGLAHFNYEEGAEDVVSIVTGVIYCDAGIIEVHHTELMAVWEALDVLGLNPTIRFVVIIGIDSPIMVFQS
jgi:hypothetical protein